MKTMKKHENMVIMVDQNIGISMKHGFSSAKTTATLFLVRVSRNSFDQRRWRIHFNQQQLKI
jgi:hypothetical protein